MERKQLSASLSLSLPLSPNMQRLESNTNLNVDQLIQTLNDQFNILADDFELRDREVQILRQKLRFSVEQVCHPLISIFPSFYLSFLYDEQT